MYLVIEGMVLVFTSGEDDDEVVSIVTEGQSFGELGLLVGMPRTTTVAAGLDVRLLRITHDVLARLEDERPELMLKMYKMLAQTLAEQWVRVGPWTERRRRKDEWSDG
jgi:CRP-like cAMP-binding protein